MNNPDKNLRERQNRAREYMRLRMKKQGKTMYSPRTDKDGYVTIYVKGKGHIKEHRHIMEEILERSLKEGESVHHKNGVRNDNRPENLELFISNHPAGQRGKELICPHCNKSYSK